jgi:uncharacterized NAD(P)/FAD-binding protein YdhS
VLPTTTRDTGPRCDTGRTDDRALTDARDTTAIVGGGCAGVLVAAHLLRVDRRPRRIVIFEPRPDLGAGVAYSTDDHRHLLNAPAGAMSAFEDDPGHFVTWLAAQGLAWRATDFVPRPLYRDYLQDVLHHELARAVPGTELSWVPESVTSLTVEERAGRSGAPLGFAHGQHRRADNVVLALGAPAPVALPALDVSPTFGMIGDPWCPGALDAVPVHGDVLILGTGLTMVDIALVLCDRDPRRTVPARSRHGLLPAAHTDDGFASWPAFDIGRPATAREALHRLRQMTVEAESEGWNWRNVIAAARTAAPEVWAGLTEPERRRLLRHLGRRWDVTRHRMSVPVAGAVADLRRRGRLTVGGGRVLAVGNDGSVGQPRLQVTLAGPGGRHETLAVGALIDCTGPGPDPTVGSPLVAGLVADGLARIHPSGIGLDVDEHGDLRGGSTTTAPIHTVGWCRRGSEFEATAVPEIRRQALRLVAHMTDSIGHRVLVPA